MNTRILCGLIVCAGGVGFVAGSGWPRSPVEDLNAKQLLSITDKIATDVIGIQHTLARGVTQCPNELVSAVTPTNNQSAPTVAATDDGIDQQRAQAEAIVMRGVSVGRWTDDDARNLRAAMSGLPSDQKQLIVTPLLQAINAQQVKLEVERGVL